MDLEKIKLGDYVRSNGNNYNFPKDAIYRVVGKYLPGYGNESVLKVHSIFGAKKIYSNSYIKNDLIENFELVSIKKLYAFRNKSTGQIVFFDSEDGISFIAEKNRGKIERFPDADITIDPFDGVKIN